jgi:spore coat polysaccharide biosynthesis protein SpsF
MKTWIVVQARSRSTRLPGKVLLPVAGIPTVVLCARRLANTGLPVCVATSDDASDDTLVETLQRAGLVWKRGPLADVLDRFCRVTSDLADSDIVVRMTADNLFPDGSFIEELIEARRARDLEYLGTDSPADGLPYGLSAEVMTVRGLREAWRHAHLASDREHVTPFLRRKHAAPPFRPASAQGDLSHLRCTMDSWDDYQRLAALFGKIEDAVGVSWQELCERLHRELLRPRVPQNRHAQGVISALTLGTAQLGVAHYGRTNVKGRPSVPEAVQIVHAAVERGVTSVDCARAYELAETVLGDALKPFGNIVRVVTKLDPLSDLPADASEQFVRAAVDASVFRSCRELQIRSLPVVLLHRWAHRIMGDGAIWRRLTELKAEGVIGALGASVASPAEATAALAEPEISWLQLPFNVLDYRWREADLEALTARRRDVAVCARSLFLQGILLAGAEVWPQLPGVEPSALLQQIDEWVRRFGRVNRADLCLAYGRACPWIQSLVIGVETQQQLGELAALFEQAPLRPEQCAELNAALPRVPEQLLNPGLWPKP